MNLHLGHERRASPHDAEATTEGAPGISRADTIKFAVPRDETEVHDLSPECRLAKAGALRMYALSRCRAFARESEPASD
jgi:hypothetical protein